MAEPVGGSGIGTEATEHQVRANRGKRHVLLGGSPL